MTDLKFHRDAFSMAIQPTVDEIADEMERARQKRLGTFRVHFWRPVIRRREDPALSVEEVELGALHAAVNVPVPVWLGKLIVKLQSAVRGRR